MRPSIDGLISELSPIKYNSITSYSCLRIQKSKIKGMFDMEKGILYLRVSSKEQEDNFSLDAQEKLGRAYAERNHIEIVRIWRGAESAWGKKERSKFNQMLGFVKRHSEVKNVIFDIADRMTRNDFDKLKIQELVKKYHKVIHFSRTNKCYNNESSSDEEFMLDIEVAAAKKMSNDISRKTKMGMQEKAEQGIYPTNTPIGYINKDRGIAVDPVNGPLVVQIFQKMASGGYSVRALAEEMFALGLRHKTRQSKISKATIDRVIKNPFYYGDFVWGKKQYHGTHKPLVSKKLWDEANAKLSGNHRPYMTKQSFPFKGLLRCGECDCTILGQKAKKKYTYYRCSFSKGPHKHGGYLSESALASKFSYIVDAVVLPPELAEWLKEALKQLVEQKEAVSEQQRKTLEREYQEMQAKLSRIYDYRLEGVGTPEQWNRKEDEINANMAQVQSALHAMGADAGQVVKQGTETVELVENLSTLFEKADNYDKAKILRMLGEEFVLDRENHIKPIYRLPFSLFVEAKEAEAKVKNMTAPSEELSCIYRKSPDRYISSRDLIWGG